MSFDLKIQNSCDHRIALERAVLEDDLLTVRVGHLIASVQSFDLYRFGTLVDRNKYTIETELDQDFVFLHPKKVVKFKVKDRVYHPVYEVNYITISDDCPKCGGVRFLDDPVFELNGDYKVVEDEALLAQYMEKYIITELSSNKYHPWVGTELSLLTTLKVQDVNFIILKIKEEIYKVTNKLKETQRQHVATTQDVSRGELLDKVISVDVSVSDIDPTIFNVSLVYKSVRGASLKFVQAIELSQFRQRSSS